ncbi:SRPBCC family protein [Leucobacter rhizosphaerae]|uniref:SRPBCC family protein n=1 Tax=Leucobacter rhizosphaerae TaxID=2932245 RepID=A0ABY4FU36_9MICO|nr:SRPBCC family protein [Leucobacter rhizosphaerae]UOQ59767.1 SRPBCC family protein [Leucobacter rhizosphaerae]
MATNTRHFQCPPEAVFDVLADGWLYPTWVVGAARMRDVDEGWPGPGARLRHSFGAWPILTDDTTRCVEWDPPTRAVFIARGWPMGEARVAFDVEARASGCWVTMTEAAIRGPVALVPRPLTNALLRWRNTEVLRRLAYIAEAKRGPDRAE